MSDPFRPNDNRQLLREAQMGFVVIGLLLCVLVYVLFYRLTGRGQRYQEMARNIPVAQSVGADPYRAHRVTKLNALNTYQGESSVPRPQAFDHAPSSSKPPRRDLTALPRAMPRTIQMPATEPQPGFMPLNKKPPVAKPFNEFEGLKPFGQHTPADSTQGTPNNVSTLTTTSRTFDAVTVDTKADPLKKVEQDFVAVPPVLKSEFGKNVKRTTAASNVFDMDKDSAAKTASIETPQRVETIGEISAQDHFDGAENSFVSQASGFSALSSQKQAAKQVEDSDSDFVASDSEKQNLNQSEFETGDDVGKHPSQNSDGDFTPSTRRVDVGEHRAGDRANSTAPKTDSSSSDTYVTVPGDSLWAIAQSAYGDGRYFRALYELNQLKLKQSEPLPAGTTIKLLAPSELRKKFPTICPRDHGVLPMLRDAEPSASGGDIDTTQPNENLAVDLSDRYYRTKDGDTLFGIARQRLGQASRYLEIYDLNQFRIPENANHLTPLREGIELLLPE